MPRCPSSLALARGVPDPPDTQSYRATGQGEIPEEPLADDNNGNNDEDDEQSFDFNIDFGGSYNPLTQTADVRGEGGITADLMRAEVDASVFAAGTVTTDLELTDPRGGVSAEVGVTIPSLGPIPLSIPIPGTNDSIGIEPTITPGIDGEFFFTDDLEFERGELTPGVEIEIETEVGVELPGVPDVSLSITVTGDLDIQFDVGTDDPEPGGEFTLSGTIIAKVPGWPVNPAIGGEIYVIEFCEGVDLAADTVRSGTDYELRPATVGGPNPLPAVPSVDAVGVGGAVTTEIGVTATDPQTVDRLTDREFEDFQPTIAALDGGHVVVWSRQAAEKPLEAEHDIVARRFDGTSYDNLAAITDDATSDTHPAAAAMSSRSGSPTTSTSPGRRSPTSRSSSRRQSSPTASTTGAAGPSRRSSQTRTASSSAPRSPPTATSGSSPGRVSTTLPTTRPSGWHGSTPARRSPS